MSRLALHDSGEGPALLLLHAYPLDASQWDHQVAAWSDRYRCVRPDFWGCGRSPAPPPEASIESYAGHLLEHLDRLGVSDFAVCGSSMGGYAAFALLRHAPQRVRALILAGTRAGPDSDSMRAARAATIEQVREHGVEAIVEPMTAALLGARALDEAHISDALRGRIRRWSSDGVITALAALAGRCDSTSLLAELTLPTLVVHGALDGIVPIAEARAMAAAIAGAQMAELGEVGHLPNLEQPAAFSERVGQFLDRSLGDEGRRPQNM